MSTTCFKIQMDAMVQLVSQPNELLGVKQIHGHKETMFVTIEVSPPIYMKFDERIQNILSIYFSPLLMEQVYPDLSHNQ